MRFPPTSSVARSAAAPLSSESETALGDDHAIAEIAGLSAGWSDFPSRTPAIPTFVTIDTPPRNPAVHSEHDFEGDRVRSLWEYVEAGLHADLHDALRELDEVEAEASENGLPIPSGAVHRNARILIPRLHRLYRGRFAVYPLLDGEIAIEATIPSKHSVIVNCEADGSILCLVNIHGRSRRAKYQGVSQLPDGFIQDALIELRETRAPVR